MALRHSTHESCGYTHNLAVTGSGAEKQVTQGEFLQRLYWDGSIWRIYDHAHSPAEGQTHGTVTNGYYVPTFFVRYFKIEGTGLYLAFDMPGSIIAGSNTFRYTRGQYTAHILHSMRITGLFLDVDRAETTCDAVELIG